MRVRVFRNLTRRCLSIQAQVPGRGWRTVAHADTVHLANATLTVREAGRQRALATGRKNVHAWVEGTLTAVQGDRAAPGYRDSGEHAKAILSQLHAMQWLPSPTPPIIGRPVTYDPRKVATFVYRDNCQPCRHAARVEIGPQGIVVQE